LQHFAPSPNGEPGEETLKFVFDVIDPFIYECWDLYAVDYDEDHEPYVYFVTALVHREIMFNVSREAAETFEDWSVEWERVSKAYREEIESRVNKALGE